MQTQTIEFAVKSRGGVVKKVGRSTVYQPRTHYSGKGLKWYEDKPKQKAIN